MSKTRLEDKFAEALYARGHKHVLSRSRKYSVFTSETPGMFYFVGRAGAVRLGRTATESDACSDAFKATLLEEYEAIKRADKLEKSKRK